MACASADVYSYAEVKVTGAAITVTPKDAAGALVREKTGGALRALHLQGALSSA